MSENVVVVYVTSPVEDAERIARHLVDNRKAACVNIIPQIRSIYRWEDQVEDEPEAMLMIKTNREHFEAVSNAIREVHPYTIPEIVCMPIADGYDGYLRWVNENVGEVDTEEAEQD